ncbi:PREDICTED: uncharacterized protein LOC104605746 isoform X2 [Nelumbo nucifera]|uniref:Uncharacterized protein LOC104605746 isoform X2 n=1 Tax=Nelumbo nucifera TaxID=4432 RepID=A0A1U8B0H6_NELNU|nr:PREDICTED: uncharacterized protein LOC104605746 isoform X2 [Nelumbo nucifera]
MTTPLRLLLPLNSAFCCSDFTPKGFGIFSQNSNFISQSPNNPNTSRPSSLSSCSPSHSKWVGARKYSHNTGSLHSRQTDQGLDGQRNEVKNKMHMFGSDEEIATQVSTQVESVVEGSGALLVSEFKPSPDVDYLQELLAIQQQGPRAIGFFGTRNMGFLHQELIEILSYAMVITKNHIFTSGASGTNAAVIRGALRAEKPELLTVILPQSLKRQPPESQELLSKVKNVIEKPHNDHLPLIEASSKLLMETCQEAKNMRKIVTLFYLD